jgi:hypothetical protein
MKTLVVLIALGVSTVSVAQTTAPTTRPEPRPLTEAQVLAQQLADADPAVQKAAWDKIQALMAAPVQLDPAGRPKPVIEPAWVRSLTRIKRYDDADKLAIEGITRRPFDAFSVSAFAKARVATLRAAGKHDAALAAAKSAYLVCPLAESAAVGDSLSAALLRVRPKDKAAAEAFKAQQKEGAAAGGENLLKTIAADAASFEPALKAITGDDATAHASRGNLLLMMDRSADAKAEFEKSLDAARVEREALAAFEGIARAIRADTGGVTAAHAYMKEQLARKPQDE